MQNLDLNVRVAARHAEADGIVAFELASPDGRPLPAFTAGSHVDVQVPGGLVRQYSLANDPLETHRYVIGVLREPQSRGGSAAMHDAVAVGDLLRISPPKNHFALDQGARRTLLFAGGIGVTPLIAMAETLQHLGAEFEMHYCCRSPARTAFAARIGGSAFAPRVQFHFDDGPAGQRLDLHGALGPVRDDTHVYVCGPGGFMDFVLGGARDAGWAPAQLHSEYFAAPAQDTSGDTAFAVRLASTGRVVDIPADVTVVRALADAGVPVPTSCEQGVCGTCLTRILEGRPDHRDAYLTDEERARNDQFLPCCSRAKTPLLVLDL